ncbi:MAG: putative transcriptional regulator [Nonlabens sp.]|jgi:putative transcriptional regulator
MKNTVHVQRAIHKITQADLSEAIGVSRQTINSIEKNRYVPSTVLALKIARLFKVAVEDIFELDEKD